MEYVLLLRGINVGGKHTVPMAELKEQLSGIGARRIETYLNSGNALFSAEQDAPSLKNAISAMLAMQYPFDIPYALIAKNDFIDQAVHLPEWWLEPMARKDVFFYTDSADRKTVAEGIAALHLDEEVATCGRIAAFWGQRSNKSFLESSLNKNRSKEGWLGSVTIRNARTFEGIYRKLDERE
jgi:uncharacterized protein (DUF1697 family)